MTRQMSILALLVTLLRFSAASGAAYSAQGQPLPPLDELLQHALAECALEAKESGEKLVGPLTTLAQVHAYRGDYEECLRMASEAGGFWGEVAQSVCVSLQVESAASPPRIPGELSEDGRLLVLEQLAKAYVRAGRFDAALDVVARIPVNAGTKFILGNAYLEIAQAQFNCGKLRAARAALQNALNAASEIPNPIGRVRHVLPVIELLVQADDAETALNATRKMEEVTLRYIREDGINRYSAIMWAQIGKAYALLNEERPADLAFSRAIEFAAAANESDEIIKGDDRLISRSKAFSEIAPLQRSVGRTREAERSLRRAIRFLSRLKDASRRPYELFYMCCAQLDAGDQKVAERVAEFVEDRDYRSRCFCRIAEHEMQDGNSAAAGHHLLKAQRLADSEPDPSKRMQMLVRIAKAQAKGGDVDAAREDFDRAMRIAEAVDHDQFQLIARIQIQAGLLPDAWRTLNQIEERRWRLFALTELTLAVAKREHAARADQRTPTEAP